MEDEDQQLPPSLTAATPQGPTLRRALTDRIRSELMVVWTCVIIAEPASTLQNTLTTLPLALAPIIAVLLPPKAPNGVWKAFASITLLVTAGLAPDAAVNRHALAATALYLAPRGSRCLSPIAVMSVFVWHFPSPWKAMAARAVTLVSVRNPLGATLKVCLGALLVTRALLHASKKLAAAYRALVGLLRAICKLYCTNELVTTATPSPGHFPPGLERGLRRAFSGTTYTSPVTGTPSQRTSARELTDSLLVLAFAAPGDLPKVLCIARTAATIYLTCFACNLAGIHTFHNLATLAFNCAVLHVWCNFPLKWVMWWYQDAPSLCMQLYALGLAVGAVVATANVVQQDVASVTHNDKTAFASTVAQNVGLSLVAYTALTSALGNAVTTYAQLSRTPLWKSYRPIIDAAFKPLECLASAPMRLSRLCAISCGMRHFWPSWFALPLPTIYVCSVALYPVATEAWSLGIQVHLNCLLYFRFWRDNSYHFPFYRILLEVGVNKDLLDFLPDLTTMNSFWAYRDILATMTGDNMAAQSEKSFYQQLALTHEASISVAASAVAVMCITTVVSVPAFGIVALGGTSLAAAHTATRLLLGSPELEVRNVTLLLAAAEGRDGWIDATSRWTFGAIANLGHAGFALVTDLLPTARAGGLDPLQNPLVIDALLSSFKGDVELLTADFATAVAEGGGPAGYLAAVARLLAGVLAL
jgi:hypothetical protein